MYLALISSAVLSTMLRSQAGFSHGYYLPDGILAVGDRGLFWQFGLSLSKPNRLDQRASTALFDAIPAPKIRDVKIMRVEALLVCYAHATRA